jgi:hypothetical protein
VWGGVGACVRVQVCRGARARPRVLLRKCALAERGEESLFCTGRKNGCGCGKTKMVKFYDIQVYNVFAHTFSTVKVSIQIIYNTVIICC